MQDIMEQVFHEMGFGSVTGLHEFYQTRVVNYHKNMMTTCKQLMNDYEKLKEPMALAAVRSPGSQKDVFNVIRFVRVVWSVCVRVCVCVCVCVCVYVCM
jgi:STAGA complex 65 subunit gamma